MNGRPQRDTIVTFWSRVRDGISLKFMVMSYTHTLMLFACLGLATPGTSSAATPAPADEPAKNIESTRATLARWVETQEILGKERREWQQSKDMLTARIDVVKREIEMVQATLATARKERGDAGQARAGVQKQIDGVQGTTRSLDAEVLELEEAAKTLYRSLPESLTDKIKPLYDRMPAAAAASRVSMAERFQNVLGILAEVTRLNSEITVATEIRPLSDGRPSEVRTVYLGLGQAYYVSAGGEAGIGRPGEAGWTWTPTPGLARNINDVLEVLQNKSSPHFVPLPVSIQ